MGRQCGNFAVKELLSKVSSRQRFVAHRIISILIPIDIRILFSAVEYSFPTEKENEIHAEMLAERAR